MSNYKCCDCGSDLGIKPKIACPKCDGFDLGRVANIHPLWWGSTNTGRWPGKPEPAALGDVWTTDPPREIGWYIVMFDNDERSIARITAVQNGNATWATLGPFGNCHIGVSDRDTDNPLISFWGERVL